MNLLIINSFCTFTLIIGLMYLLKTGKIFNKKIEQLFFVAIVCIFILTISDMIEFYLADNDTLNNLRYITSMSGYILRTLILVIFIHILLRHQKNRFLLWIPFIVEVLIVITTPFNHWMFHFDQNNVFYRGPLGFTAHVISALYDLMFIIIAYKMSRFTEHREIFMAIFVVVVTSIATILETSFGVSFLLSGTFIVSGTIYYIYLYEQIYKYDVLTGLLNRRSFETDTQRILDKSFAVISIDLNNLKTINDTLGHAAGDEAIKTVANIARNVGRKIYNVYRIGGDEFMVIGLNQNTIQSNEFVQALKEQLRNTGYSASLGQAIYTPDKDFGEVCAEADANMYIDKQEMKRNLG